VYSAASHIISNGKAHLILAISECEVSFTLSLKVLRAEHEWTQAALAAELEVSRQTVNAIETGKFDPSLPLAFKVARLFGLTIEEIFEDQAD